MDNLLPHATPTDELGQRNACVNADALYFPLGSRASSDVRGFCLSLNSDTCERRRHAQSANSFRLRPFARHAAKTFRNARISSHGIKRVHVARARGSRLVADAASGW
jgi:hypothetical protein